MSIVDKLIAIANGFRLSRGTTDKLSLDEMATLAAEPMKLPQVIDRTVTELTAEDLAGVTSIGMYAFSYCHSLTSVTIGNSVTSIGSQAFTDCISLTSVNILDSVTKIDSYAFYCCTSLTSVNIPDSVTSIGRGVFNSCSTLMSITLPNSLTSIGSSAFSSCGSLTSVNIPDSVTSISDGMFSYCRSLTSVTIPNGVTSIGSQALCIGDSPNKATITFLGTTPPSIKTNTFVISYIEKIIVPAGCGEAYKSATNWANFADYIEEATA